MRHSKWGRLTTSYRVDRGTDIAAFIPLQDLVQLDAAMIVKEPTYNVLFIVEGKPTIGMDNVATAAIKLAQVRCGAALSLSCGLRGVAQTSSRLLWQSGMCT